MARFFGAAPTSSVPETEARKASPATSATKGQRPNADVTHASSAAGASHSTMSRCTAGDGSRCNRRPRLRRQYANDFDHALEKSIVPAPALSCDSLGSGYTEAPSSRGASSEASPVIACSPSDAGLEELLSDLSDEDDFSWLEEELPDSMAPEAGGVGSDAGNSLSGGIVAERKEHATVRDQVPETPSKYQAPLELRVEDFECGECIGKGSYSRVFLGMHIVSGTEWALKVVSKRKTYETKENLAHLKEEKKIAAKLQDSDFLVRTAGTFQNPRSVVFAMEYLPGGDLYQRLADKGVLPLGEAVAWAAQALLAVEDLHARNIVHRDVKPENFLMGKSGTLKLTDFGFARELAPGERLFSQFGTPEYVAPEVLNGCGHGKPVDLWALGVLIYELLVGRTPFKATNVDEMYERIAAGDYAFPPRTARRPPTACKASAQQDGPDETPTEAKDDGGVIDGAQDPAAQSLVKKLLCLAPARRPGIAEIKRHAFFDGVNFDALRAAVRAQADTEEDEAVVSAAIEGGDVWLRGQPVRCLSEDIEDKYGGVFAEF